MTANNKMTDIEKRIEEIRPCPFCGEIPIPKSPFGNESWEIKCKNHLHIGFKLTQDKEQSRRLWNNAYCWKEIDRFQRMEFSYKHFLKILQPYAEAGETCQMAAKRIIMHWRIQARLIESQKKTNSNLWKENQTLKLKAEKGGEGRYET